MITEGDVQRMFGGELVDSDLPDEEYETTGLEEEIPEMPTGGGDMRDASEEAWNRFSAIDQDSKRIVLERAMRLKSETWPWPVAADLSCGILPEELTSWPALPRYRVANGVSERDVRKEIDDWFWRNHYIEHEEA